MPKAKRLAFGMAADDHGSPWDWGADQYAWRTTGSEEHPCGRQTGDPAGILATVHSAPGMNCCEFCLYTLFTTVHITPRPADPPRTSHRAAAGRHCFSGPGHASYYESMGTNRNSGWLTTDFLPAMPNEIHWGQEWKAAHFGTGRGSDFRVIETFYEIWFRVN